MLNKLKQTIAKRFMDWGGMGYTYTGNGFGSRYTRNTIQTQAGPLIDETTAMTIPAFLHAIRLYAQTLGSQSWDLYQFEGKGRQIARSHPVHRLIHDEPNEFQLPSAFRETIIAHAISYGNGYAYIERNGNMRPTAMIPLLPDRTYPTRVNGQLSYTTYINNQQKILQPDEVFHIAGLSTNGLTGLPLVKLMSESLGLTKAEENFASAFFGNGCNFGGTLATPNKLSDQAHIHLKNDFEDQSGGLGNAFRWIILEEGLTASQNQVDAEKSQLTQSRQYQIGELARIVGLPPHMLYELSRATFSNIEAQGIQAVQYSFKPWANKLCQEANRKLLYESEKGIYETVLDLSPMMAGDSKTQAETDAIDFNMGALTPNERRAKRGLNPIEGGDSVFVNSAIVPLDVLLARLAAGAALPNGQDPVVAAPVAVPSVPLGSSVNDGDPSNDDATPASNANVINDGPAVPADVVEDANGGARSATALRPAVADVVSRLIRREAKAATTAFNRHRNDSGAFNEWLATSTPATKSNAVEALRGVCESVALLTGTVCDPSAFADKLATETRSNLSAVIASTDPQADFDLMIEGWHTQTTEQLITTIVGVK